MFKSIKKTVGIQVAAALASIILFSVVTTVNILSIERTQAASTQANALLDRAQTAEVAHYKWASNLSNALYAGTEFTGSIDPTTCALGQWLYGEAGTEDETVLALRAQLEPLHKELHGSASSVLELYKTQPIQAQEYYQTTIQNNLATLVGLLDQVVDRGSTLSEELSNKMHNTILTMHALTTFCLVLALFCLISLVYYVLRHIVRPILVLTEQSKPLQEGRLDLDLKYKSDNELGILAQTLGGSVALIHDYIEDINRMMGQLSEGNFNVRPSAEYIGDFRRIETSIDSFTSTLSKTMEQINQAEHRVSGHAEQLSSGAQALAQGATQQASAVEELYATLDELSRSATNNVKAASDAQENARLTGEQVTVSSEQMAQMVSAMADITQQSREIEKIISTIEDIAFQTNILALNAAVEAARAGTAGKGFAVVSSEVRSLAGRSDEAAKATKELIENSVRAAERGNEIVGEVSKTLKRTLELVTQSNTTIGTIAEAVHSEAASIAQVTEGIGQISSVVQTNSASSEESAAVSSELFEQVRLLQEQTRKFKLKQ
ncbi:MAG: HAMP domain-containing protein [Oscillospiraceae bacterium]|nr:HAMP domain-containing protein [Oscillospiraceae bacterium]